MIDSVSEVTRLSWDKVFELNIIELFNILCYCIDKNNYERSQLDKARKIRRY